METGGPSAPVPGDDRAPDPAPASARPGTPVERDYVTAPPSPGPPGTGWWVGAIVAALVLGVGGYLIGHNIGQSTERDNFDAGAPGYNDIYQQGVAAGKAAGTQQGQAQGAAQGEQAGLEQGKQQGEQQGVAEGTKAGADAALGGFSTWQAGAPYVIKVEKGSGAVAYQIFSRTLMEAGTDYALCKDAPTTVCTVPESSGSSGSSGGSTGSGGSGTSTTSGATTTSSAADAATTSDEPGG
jgi:hypothetical protein